MLDHFQKSNNNATIGSDSNSGISFVKCTPFASEQLLQTLQLHNLSLPVAGRWGLQRVTKQCT